MSLMKPLNSRLWYLVALALLIFQVVLLVRPSGHTLQEDDPGWNCHTMGNLQCGPGQ